MSDETSQTTKAVMDLIQAANRAKETGHTDDDLIRVQAQCDFAEFVLKEYRDRVRDKRIKALDGLHSLAAVIGTMIHMADISPADKLLTAADLGGKIVESALNLRKV